MSSALKALAKRVLPEAWTAQLRRMLNRRRARRGCRAQAARFIRHAVALERPHTQAHLAAQLQIDAHRIEKGLSLRTPRVLFGAQVVQRLLDNLERYRRLYPPDAYAWAALDNLDAYAAFNADQGEDVSALEQRLRALRGQMPAREDAEAWGGAVERTRAQIREAVAFDYEAFVATRSSVRQFEPGEVDPALLRQAADYARRAPSVCNRQPWRTHVLSRERDKALILGLQNGNRGFGHEADKVLVTTGRLERFLIPWEHHECWVDGGMYTMALLYALHALELGACCLNWCVPPEIDAMARERLGLDPDETIVAIIAVGRLPERFRVARSRRFPLADSLVFHPGADEDATTE